MIEVMELRDGDALFFSLTLNCYVTIILAYSSRFTELWVERYQLKR